jgi:uncharacterized protein (TIGR00369 family)
MTRSELEAIIDATPFARLLGAQLLDFGEGRASLSVPLRAELKMHLDIAHGAVVGFMADSACAWAAASLAGNVVTAEYKLNLMAPGHGESLVATGEVLKTSGRTMVCRADVFALAPGRETLIATALASISKLA